MTPKRDINPPRPMKYLLAATLTFTPPDTTPYIHNGYYDCDTVTTMQQYRVQNLRMAKQLKASERHSGISMILGFILGAVLVGGALNVLKP